MNEYGNFDIKANYGLKFEWSGENKTLINDLRFYVDYKNHNIWF